MSGIIAAPSELDVQSTGVLVSVALDIGTSFSGFAFLTRNDFKINPLRVVCKHWHVGELGTLYKTKSIILLNQKKEFVAFGYDAENKYARMSVDEAKEYYYFPYFKMALYGEQSLRKNMKIPDESGNKMPAYKVFGEAIKFLKDAALEELLKSCVIKETDVKWIVTLPAIWSESAKQFMVYASKEVAGIAEDKLEITLEPESAALCCNYLALERNEETSVSLKTFDNGRKIMVLDLGGGTVDITTYQVTTTEGKNTLKEIYKATGGPWGGRKVDEAFENFWSKCLGTETWKKLKLEYRDEIYEFFNRFEIQKRSYKHESREKISLTLPECIREVEGLSSLLSEQIGDVSIKRGKITFPDETFNKFFDACLKGEDGEGLVKMVDGLFSNEKMADIYAVLMVGGLSESSIVQTAIKETLSQKSRAKVFVPTEPGSVVLKGAAIYGFAPDIIMERVIRHTVGISTRVAFDEEKHSRSSAHYHKVENEEYIEDKFHPFVRAGDTIQPGEQKTHNFNAVAVNSHGSLEIEVYASTERDPEYTRDPNSESTWKLGCVSFPKFDKQNLGTTVTVNMTFGCTRLHVNAKLENGDDVDCSLNLLK
ncbi:heat shock 70 kDa protein 12B-like [Mytilus californianus]|uniref:heat shock 70 kDa protein 12B-like n=1 Tax=Mytilus californianus TaxID=6549 RepID=UPI002247F88D|nr:heat shock 70 kDa protein 12B-like [Mytilus californianus]XP_052094752.1 heat shock 70 kDa protein 12B-like [Mytilus californianus]XP_052094753.1 heat shock 70 kDa protein 12B-like [Mytilus californianus]